MTSQLYNLEFDGFWRRVKVRGVPNSSGIYCVYTCTYDQSTKKVSLSKSSLIYIGESKRVRERIVDHERMSDWEEMLRRDQELCFSFAPISPKGERQRAEAALIYFHEPPLNEEYKNKFPFDTTEIKTSGKRKELTSYFRVP